MSTLIPGLSLFFNANINFKSKYCSKEPKRIKQKPSESLKIII